MPVDLISLDLSFISVLKVMPAVCEMLRPGGVLIVLVKPQFEAGRDKVRVLPIACTLHSGKLLHQAQFVRPGMLCCCQRQIKDNACMLKPVMLM